MLHICMTCNYFLAFQYYKAPVITLGLLSFPVIWTFCYEFFIFFFNLSYFEVL